MTDQERADMNTATEIFGRLAAEDRLRVLELYATLRYRSAVARFFDAVHLATKEANNR